MKLKMIMNIYHPSLPQVSVRRCANMACRKPGERCDLGEGRRNTAKPGWLLRMPWATPPGRRGRRRHPSSEQETTVVCLLKFKDHAHTGRVSCHLVLCVSHHLANDDDFWPQLFMNGKDVNEAKGEHHVVHTQDIPSKFIGPLEHS